MDEKYSKRQIILESNDILIDETDFDDSFIDELEDITSLIQSNSSYSNDFISDRTQDENLDNEILTEDIVKDIDKEEQGSVENIDGDSLDSENDINDDSTEDEIKSQNNSIKLDLFLKYCVDNHFLYNFLRYKTVDADGDKDTLISRILSSFDLRDIINYKYKYTSSRLENIFDSFIKPLKVVDLVEIAERYDVKVSLSKGALKNNFFEKFDYYDLILILSNEGLDISDYSKISVLEQIYLLRDEKLMKESEKCPNIEKSRNEMISCVVKNFSEGFLISNNKFEREDD